MTELSRRRILIGGTSVAVLASLLATHGARRPRRTGAADDKADAPGLRPLIGELTTLVVADLLQPK
jgi:hypothetical protein